MGASPVRCQVEPSRGQERLPDDFHYTYTDISSGFFEPARAKLAKWAPYITYQKLDVSRELWGAMAVIVAAPKPALPIVWMQRLLA